MQIWSCSNGREKTIHTTIIEFFRKRTELLPSRCGGFAIRRNLIRGFAIEKIKNNDDNTIISDNQKKNAILALPLLFILIILPSRIPCCGHLIRSGQGCLWPQGPASHAGLCRMSICLSSPIWTRSVYPQNRPTAY